MADTRDPRNQPDLKDDRLGQKLIREVRAYLRDDPLLNELLDGKESTDGQIKTSLLDSVDDWNITDPPLAIINVKTHPSRRLLVRGAVIEIMQSAGIYYARNRLDYNDGGIAVRDKDKWSEYSQIIQFMKSDYESKKISRKKSLNIALGFGQIPSEYRGVGRGSDGDENVF